MGEEELLLSVEIQHEAKGDRKKELVVCSLLLKDGVKAQFEKVPRMLNTFDAVKSVLLFLSKP